MRSRPRSDVPLVDLSPAHGPLRDDLIGALARALDSGRFVGGEEVEAFEEEFAAAAGRAYCVGTSSGTDALRLALLAAGVVPGYGVAVPALTFAATWEAVLQAGGRLVPVDVSEQDLCIDPGALGEARGWSYVVPVHLHGQMADMKRISAFSGAAIVEDAAQAFGASRDGAVPGDLSDAAAYSFYPSKNLGALGDAGAVVCDRAGLARTVRSLADHGRDASGHGSVGYTARLDALQAAFLRVKLPHAGGWLEQRRAAAARYSVALAGVGDLRLPEPAPGSEHSWHLYVVRTRDPYGLGEHLRARGIETGRHYRRPLHFEPAYRRDGAFPVAERAASEVLSLPLFPGITEGQQARVVEAVEGWFRG